MWHYLATTLLKYRLALLIVVMGFVGAMGFLATKVEIAYQYARLLPDKDPASVDYDFFKSHFGQDGTVMVLGIRRHAVDTLRNYQAWARLSEEVKGIQGIKGVVSITRLNELQLNDTLGKFTFVPLKPRQPATQQQLDTLLQKISTLKFYDGIVFNDSSDATLMAITFYEKDLNNRHRMDIADSIHARAAVFSKMTGIEVHYSGLPYIRTIMTRKISHETTFFLVISVLVTALLLTLFFKSVQPVLFSVLVVASGVACALGSMVFLGYKLTVLSGLIPPLIMVIGVPNCIFILNKYHAELAAGRTKMEALHLAIERSSVSLFFANITTAIGFAVFCVIENRILFEFGLIASINVMITYLLSLVLVPIIFSFLPAPHDRHLLHLNGPRLHRILDKVAQLTQHRRKLIYTVLIVLLLFSIYGITRIKALGYVVDDLPKKDPLLLDLHYFEKKYGGVLPFEITIDTRKENGLFSDNARLLYKINRLQRLLSHYPELSRPVSITDAVKFLFQSYKGGDPKYYRLPAISDLKNLAEYVRHEKEQEAQLSSFIDSTRRYTRVSVQMADVGSVRVRQLVEELRPRVDSIFNYDDENRQWLPPAQHYNIRLTGNSIMFLKGNDFLVHNLVESVILAIVLIAAFMLTLFSSLRMILISIIPSLSALIITAGVMGYAGIYLKPSTILVFSIAFGISSDGTLYFLTKYRHELRHNRLSIAKAVRVTIRETGISMIYTCIVLFFGFGMFAFSGFGGTQALGILLAFTLMVAYCANLVLLPAFLLSLQQKLGKQEFKEDSFADEPGEEQTAS